MTASETRRLVVERAKNRCEYCRLPQRGQAATFHLDHILPRVEDGPDDETNLALACPTCSLRKGRKTEVLDPADGSTVGLFNPRTMTWPDHFTAREDGSVEGRTPCGRASTACLRLNDGTLETIRAELFARGLWPAL